jgi:hypothetical protein
MNPCWSFPLSHETDSRGYNASDFEAVKYDPFVTLAREMIQNALDARDGDNQVKIEFELMEAPTSDFPGLEDYKNMISQCLEKCKSQPEAANKFDSMLQTFAWENISWLRISDFGTKGMAGSEKRGDLETPWFAFTKSTGSSIKPDSRSGGSKGQGKNAVFVNSQIQAMFVSSMTKEGIIASQGVAKLISVKAGRYDYTTGIGYYGNPDGNQPLFVPFSPRPDYSRNVPGTDIFIPAFRDQNDIESVERGIRYAALESFMPAILNGTLSLDAFGQIIDKQSLASFCDQRNTLFPPKQSAILYLNHRCLTSSAKKTIDFKQCGFYKPGYEMKLLVILANPGEESTNKTFAYRYPWMRISSVKGIRPEGSYSAVLLLEGDKLNERLRYVENATHTSWDISAIDPKSSYYPYSELKEAIDLVSKFVQWAFDEVIWKSSLLDSSDFEGAGDFLPAKEQKEKGTILRRGMPIAETDISRHQKRKRARTKKNQIPSAESQTDAFSEELASQDGESNRESFDENGNVPSDPLPGTHNSEEKAGSEGTPNLPNDGGDPAVQEIDGKGKLLSHPIEVARTILALADKESGKYRLIFTVKDDAENVSVSIGKIGIEGEKETTEIKTASLNGVPLEVLLGRIVLNDVAKDTRYVVDLELSDRGNYAWEVKFYGNYK